MTNETSVVPPSTCRTFGAPKLIPLVIFLSTLAAFLPSLQNGFVSWDDPQNFLGNPNYRGLGIKQLQWMFTTFLGGPYQPLSWLTLGFDFILWGMNPLGYHLTNLLLHSLNAVLFYFLSMRLLKKSLVGPEREVALWAALAALFFSVHPLRVESVAWITERRDSLSGLFYLLTVHFYLKSVSPESTRPRRHRVLSISTFVLALLSKASGVGLPIVLLALDFCPLKRIPSSPTEWFSEAMRPVWIEKAPYFLCAGVFGVIGLWGQNLTGATLPLAQYGVLARLGQSFFGLSYYLWKTVFPIHLTPFYEIPHHISLFQWPFLGSAALVLIITGVFIQWRKRHPGLLAGWVIYLALLFPVLGIVKMGAQLVADRYTYLSCMVWPILGVAGLNRAWPDVRPLGRKISILALMAVLRGLMGLTWNQTRIWHDSISLWSYTVRQRPNSSLAHNSLGEALGSQGMSAEAIHHYRTALDINPNYADAHINLGLALAEQGQIEDAVPHLEKGMDIKEDGCIKTGSCQPGTNLKQ